MTIQILLRLTLPRAHRDLLLRSQQMAIQVFRTVAEVRKWKSGLPQHANVGFVPTMGALHRGHISLVEESLKQSDHTVVSIFVNPSQFAPHEDLDQYPRTFEADMEKLSQVYYNGHGVDAIFAPTVQEMYPSGITLEVADQQGTFIFVLGVSEQLEGKTRPNFFRGVATVVTKLLNAVGPNTAYFGQKDIQQTIVLKRMVMDLLIPTEIVVLPIYRESSGLAMSSRNAYLSEELKEKCSLIYKALKQGQDQAARTDERDGIVGAVEAILQDKAFKIDYVSVADPDTLKELESIAAVTGAILSVAVYVTENGRVTRLIDNVIL